MRDYIPQMLPEYVEVEPDVFQPYGATRKSPC